jgi:hypothetical protein
MTAYDKGREAYDRGDDSEMNPYDDADAQWDNWRDGFFDAEEDDAWVYDDP